MRGPKGFTLLELMIAVAILGIASIYLLETFTVTEQTYTVVDQVTETQQNMRVISSMLEHDIRHAGYLVPIAGAFCGVDNTNDADLLYLSDSDAIDDTNARDADFGSSFAGNNVVTGANTLDLDLAVEDPPVPAYDTNGDGAADSDFLVGGGVIILDRNNPGRGTACGTVTAVDVGNSRIQISIVSAPLGALVGAASLMAVGAHEYRINGAVLVRDGLEMANSVEDLQLAYFIDANGDNLVDPGEYRGDGVGADYSANQIDASDLREIRFNLVTRTRGQDQNFPGGRFQATENRAAVAGTDGFRRRIHTGTTLVRNVVLRAAL